VWLLVCRAHACLSGAADCWAGYLRRYFIRGAIVVAPGVILKGSSREEVVSATVAPPRSTDKHAPRSTDKNAPCGQSIYFAEDNQTSAPPAYLTSSAPGAWGIEDLTFYITAYANDIVRFVPGTDGGFLRRSRIRFNSYFCLEPQQGKCSRGRCTGWSHDVGVAGEGNGLRSTDKNAPRNYQTRLTRPNAHSETCRPKSLRDRQRHLLERRCGEHTWKRGSWSGLYAHRAQSVLERRHHALGYQLEAIHLRRQYRDRGQHDRHGFKLSAVCAQRRGASRPGKTLRCL
jgi:hypothetical protein